MLFKFFVQIQGQMISCVCWCSSEVPGSGSASEFQELTEAQHREVMLWEQDCVGVLLSWEHFPGRKKWEYLKRA